MILEGRQQQQELTSWICSARAGDRVDLIAPWISEESICRILNSRRPGVQVNIVTRFPGSVDELNFTAWKALNRIQAEHENVSMSIVDDPGKLHAKVYRVKGEGVHGAIVTSANLTETGLSVNGRGNIELGVKLGERETLKSLGRWIDDLRTIPFNPKRIGELIARQEELNNWYKRAEKLAGPPPRALPNPSLGSDLAAEVINDLLEKGEIRDATRLENGYGSRAFELDLNTRKSKFRVKVVTSQVRTAPVCGVDKEFHFELNIDVLKEWKREKNSIHGVILVPYGRNVEGQDFVLSDPPPCILPLSFLFGKGGKLPYAKFIKGRSGSKAVTPTINLCRLQGEKEWRLRYSFLSDSGKVDGKPNLPQRECLGSTRLLKKSRMLQ